MVKLFCVIDGVAESSFPVDIDADQTVADLKKAIKTKNEDITAPARKLQLFLAKKDEGRGAWLTEADVKKADGLTPLDAGGAPLNLVGLSKKDVKFQVTRQHVMAKTTPVHVLVVVPKQENDRSPAMALGVAPSLPPTTIHRHPERLKRWAAINAMIRQKNQEANQKTTSGDVKHTNKKRKKHDIDKT
uniref:Crinkler effector protein N-terminal domain-containing protein n=2 Tax=Phytophthora ramorum TaxID=164328 RepID=H3HA96_PHYRM